MIAPRTTKNPRPMTVAMVEVHGSVWMMAGEAGVYRMAAADENRQPCEPYRVPAWAYAAVRRAELYPTERERRFKQPWRIGMYAMRAARKADDVTRERLLTLMALDPQTAAVLQQAVIVVTPYAWGP